MWANDIDSRNTPVITSNLQQYVNDESPHSLTIPGLRWPALELQCRRCEQMAAVEDDTCPSSDDQSPAKLFYSPGSDRTGSSRDALQRARVSHFEGTRDAPMPA